MRVSLTRTNGDAVGRLRILDDESDPHSKLGRRDVVIFPLERLDWGQRYRVEAAVRLDGELRELDWSFSTTPADGELIELDQRMPYHVIEPGVRYALYAPPPTFARLADGVSWRYPPRSRSKRHFRTPTRSFSRYGDERARRSSCVSRTVRIGSIRVPRVAVREHRSHVFFASPVLVS